MKRFKLSEQDIRREDWASLEPTIEGWGINDVNYKVRARIGESDKRNECPYYQRWREILRRSLNEAYKRKDPSYKDCTVGEGFKYFYDFIVWLDQYNVDDWSELEIDKDLLCRGNKHYSPDTCVIVSSRLNNFVLNNKEKRGEHLLGVTKANSKKNPYMARCCNPFTKERIYLGVFATEYEAHLAWQSCKHEISCTHAETQTDLRIKQALLERYAPDKDWTKE